MEEMHDYKIYTCKDSIIAEDYDTGICVKADTVTETMQLLIVALSDNRSMLASV